MLSASLLLLGLVNVKPMNIYASGWKQHMLPLTRLRMMMLNGAVKIDGTNRANGAVFQIPVRKIARTWVEHLVVKTRIKNTATSGRLI